MLSRGYTGRLPGAVYVGDHDGGRLVDGHDAPVRRTPRGPRCPVGAAMTASLRVSGLAFAYPDGYQALFGVDLEIERGERVALLGPNGAGKTTLVLHLNGLLSGGVGTVEVAGLPVREGELPGDPPTRRSRVPGSRRPALHAHGPRRCRVRPGQHGAVRRRAGPARQGGTRTGGHGRLRRSAAAPPVLRPAPTRRGGDRARHEAGDPRARRAVEQPRPGQPARAGRHPAQPGHHGADGHA